MLNTIGMMNPLKTLCGGLRGCFVWGRLLSVAFLTTRQFKNEKPKTKNGNDTGFVFIKTDQQNISQRGGLDRLVDVETVD
jgi:hypothetical protein